MFKFFKSLLPRSLLARSLIIMLIPLLLADIVAFDLLLGPNLNFVSRRFTQAVSGEIAQTVDLLQQFPKDADQKRIIGSASRNYLVVSILPNTRLKLHKSPDILGPFDDDLASALRGMGPPLNIDWQSEPSFVLVSVQLRSEVVVFKVPRKRLEDDKVVVFLLWVSAISGLMFIIAALFMRNQVRAIRRLAKAADNFGRGQDAGPIQLEGATEVRLAATAFNRMQERIRRFITQRIEMLAGVSHDLRTPLTRLRLAVAMLPNQSAEMADMNADLEEMDRMIGAYLAFARGDGEEQPQTFDLDAFLRDIVATAARGGTRIERGVPARIAIHARPDALRRAINNLTGNAAKFATRIRIETAASGRAVEIMIDDNGPGMPEHQREQAFRAFSTTETGGTGLGLTIARDVIRSHGGEIWLESSPMGGLRARVRLPL